jgi:hypothetical protein
MEHHRRPPLPSQVVYIATYAHRPNGAAARPALHTLGCRLVGDTKSLQDPGGIWADLDAGAYFADRARLLIHVYIDTPSQQR